MKRKSRGGKRKFRKSVKQYLSATIEDWEGTREGTYSSCVGRQQLDIWKSEME